LTRVLNKIRYSSSKPALSFAEEAKMNARSSHRNQILFLFCHSRIAGKNGEGEGKVKEEKGKAKEGGERER
jgi:hypothetical protein